MRCSPYLFFYDFGSPSVFSGLPIIFQAVPPLKCGRGGGFWDQSCQLCRIVKGIIQHMCVPDSAQHTVDYSDCIDGLSAMLKGGLLLFELNRDAALRQNHDSRVKLCCI